METGRKLDIKNEILRKTIHVGYSTVPFIYLLTNKSVIIPIVIVLSVFMIIVDLGRIKFVWLQNLYMMALGKILRNHETNNSTALFTGGTYIVLSSLFCFLIFPKDVAISAMLITTFGDTAAALYGKYFGKVKMFGKTLEGSLVFFITGCVILYFMGLLSGVFLIPALAALVITTVLELLPIPIDDNITIPVSFCLVFTGMSMLTGAGCLC
jgi:dolichol kinase